MAKKLYANGVTGDVIICEADADMSNPLSNIDKIYFHSALDYLRIETIIDVTMNLPQRTRSDRWWGFINYQLYQHNLGYRPLFAGYFTGPDELVKVPFCGEVLVQAQYYEVYLDYRDYFRTILLGSDDTYLYFQEFYYVKLAYDYETMPAITLNARLFLMSEV